MEILALIFGAIFLTNILLNYLVGYPLLNKDTKLKDIFTVGIKSLVLALVTSAILYPINNYLLKGDNYDWTFLLPILAILIVLNLNNLTNLILSKIKLENYVDRNFDIYVPFNAVVISTLLIMVTKTTYLGALASTLGLGLGYILVTLLAFTIKPRLELPGVPKAFKGIPLLLITLGFIGMVFVGLAGVL